MLAWFSILEVPSAAGRLANKIVRIHQCRASARLRELARADGMAVPAPDGPGSDPRLSSDTRSTDAFIERAIQSHLEAIYLYEAESPDAQVRAFARRILPQLHRRVAALRLLQAAKTTPHEFEGAREKPRDLGEHRNVPLDYRP